MTPDDPNAGTPDARAFEPSRRPGPGAVGKPPYAPGSPPAEGRDAARPELPHERDESAGVTAAKPDPMMEQAARDLDAGLVDTDLRRTPGLDAERRAEIAGETRPDADAASGQP